MVELSRRAGRKTQQAVTEYLARTGRGPGGLDALRDGTLLLGKTLEAIDRGGTGTVQGYAATRVKDTEVAKGDEVASGDTARQYECYSRGHDFYSGEWCIILRLGGTGMEIIPFSGAQSGAGIGAAWTIAEFDASTGALVQTFDRGRRRGGNITLADHDILLSSDGYLYAIGAARLATGTPAIVKWDIDSPEPESARVWDSSRAGFNTPTLPNDGASEAGSLDLLVEASDGAIWGAPGSTTSSYVGRFNPTTGVQTHAGYSLSNSGVICKADASGGVVTRTTTHALRVLDNTATSVATVANVKYVLEHNGQLFAAIVGGGLKRYDGVLSEQDSTATGTHIALATDGSSIFTTSTGAYYSFDATNLGTTNWTASRDGTFSTPYMIIYKNSYLWDFSEHVRKLDPADGSEVWESGTDTFDPSGTPRWAKTCAVGSDFVVMANTGATTNLFCLNASDGSLRWIDFWTTIHSVKVNDDDRIFVCGRRTGP